MNRFSMVFKTRFDNSALFHASGGDQGIDHYIGASIHNKSVYVEIDFGDDPMSIVLGQNANLNEWNNLTIFHENDKVHVSLNDERVSLNISGNSLLYIDPEIYIGGGPELRKKKGLWSTNNFVGSIKYVFYNDISIMYELKKLNPKVHYIGILRPEFFETDIEVRFFCFTSKFVPSCSFENTESHIYSENADHNGTLLMVLCYSCYEFGLVKRCLS